MSVGGSKIHERLAHFFIDIYTLSVINCVVTMILMMFMLPFGIQDGLLACIASL